MVYLVYERKKIIMLSLGFLVILIAGSWFFLNKALPAKEVKAPLLEVELQQAQQQSPKKSDSEKVKKQEFFVDCRLTRDRIRSQQVDVLKEIAVNPLCPVAIWQTVTVPKLFKSSSAAGLPTISLWPTTTTSLP
jgi:hypothetical protein